VPTAQITGEDITQRTPRRQGRQGEEKRREEKKANNKVRCTLHFFLCSALCYFSSFPLPLACFAPLRPLRDE